MDECDKVSNEDWIFIAWVVRIKSVFEKVARRICKTSHLNDAGQLVNKDG